MRTLLDSSSWIEHFAKPDPEIGRLATQRELLVHPFVIGELAMGRLRERKKVLDDLNDLETVAKADDAEVIGFVERYHLYGTGIGWIDAHLLAAARLAGVQLMTHDLAMKQAWAKIKSSR